MVDITILQPLGFLYGFGITATVGGAVPVGLVVLGVAGALTLLGACAS